MSDHTINLAMLAVTVLTFLAEGAIFWMILQDYRRMREMPEVPLRRWLALVGLSCGPLLSLLLVYFFWVNTRPSHQVKAATSQQQPMIQGSHHLTRVFLQFDADGVPHTVQQDNIFHWFALWHAYTYKAADDLQMHTQKTLTLYLEFTDPVYCKEFKITGIGVHLPLYEVKDQTERHAIIEFTGPIANGMVSVDLIN
jgi:hypothetical protein